MSSEYEVILLTSEGPKALNRCAQSFPIAKKSEAKSRGIPDLAKTIEVPRISCTQLWTGPRVRLSLREAHEVQGAHETPQEIGAMGHPESFLRAMKKGHQS
jgi:hypothetical protein